jgi:hypothetical protein
LGTVALDDAGFRDSKLSSPGRIRSGHYAPFDSSRVPALTQSQSRLTDYQYNYGGNNASFQVPAQSTVSRSRQPTVFEVSVVDCDHQHSDHYQPPNRSFMMEDSSAKKSYLKRDYTPKKKSPPRKEYLVVATEPEEAPVRQRREDRVETLSVNYSEYQTPKSQRPSPFTQYNVERIAPNHIQTKDSLHDSRSEESYRRELTFDAPQRADRLTVPEKVPVVHYGIDAQVVEKSVERVYIKSPEKSVQESSRLSGLLTPSKRPDVRQQLSSGIQDKLKVYNLPIPASTRF